MLKILLRSLALLLLLAPRSFAQGREGCFDHASWISAADGLSGMPLSATEHQGRLYLLYAPRNAPPDLLKIAVWDGDLWRDSIAVSATSPSQAGLTLTSLNGRLHLYGLSYGSRINVDIPGGMTGWNGTAWEKAGPHDSSWVFQAVEFRGESYIITGRDLMPGLGTTMYIPRLMRLRNGAWEQVGDFRLAPGSYFSPYAMVNRMAVTDNGRGLYVGGKFDSVDGAPMRNVALWDGTRFLPVGEGIDGIISNPPGNWVKAENMMTLGNDLYVITSRDTIWHWDGSAWKTMAHLPEETGDLTGKYQGMIYSSIPVPSNNQARSVYRWRGDSVEQISGLVGRPISFIEHDGELYAFGEIISSCGTLTPGVARLCTSGSCGSVTGTIYRDGNGNCLRDTLEPALPGVLVEFTPGSHLAVSDRDGRYRAMLPPNSYTARVIAPRHWRFCDPVQTMALSTPGTRHDSVDFGGEPTAAVHDLGVSLAAARARVGRPMGYSIRYTGIGPLPSDGIVRLQLDPTLTYIWSSVAPSRVVGNTLEWDFSALAMFVSRDIQVTVTVPPSLPGGTEICSRADVMLTSDIDAFEADNHDMACTPALNSYDPNAIVATPGSGGDAIYDLTPADTTIAYTVHVQNTGNDTAYRVVILDTLGSRHDITTVAPGAASHPYTYDFPSPEVLRLTFEGINLPDSTASEPGSHGWVKFTVRIRKSLVPGTLIPNHAGIYFDANPEVRTNTVISRVGASSSVPTIEHPSPLTLSPNPAHGVTRAMLGSGGGSVEIHDMLGKRILRQTTAAESMELDLSGLQPGSYLLRAVTRQGTAEERLVVR